MITCGAESYILPADIWDLLIDYIPLYMYGTCRNVSFIPPLPNALKWSWRHEHMLDAIRRNDIDYCLNYFTSYIPRPDVCMVQWDELTHVNRNGAPRMYWQEAIKYGRIEILNMFYEIDSKCTYTTFDLSNYHPYDCDLIGIIPDNKTFRWFLNAFHGTLMSSVLVNDLVRRAVVLEDLDTLQWLHHAKPVTRYNPPFTTRDTVTYLEFAVADTSVNRGQGSVLCLIKERPKVLSWYITQKVNVSRTIEFGLDEMIGV
jgi:hypothetical protein